MTICHLLLRTFIGMAFSTPLCATIIGNIDCPIETDVRPWQHVRSFRTPENQIKIYLPNGKKFDESYEHEEIFTVQIIQERMELPALLKQESIYGYGDLSYTILKQTEDSLLAEWWTSGEARSMHGWIRCLHTPQATTSLQYTTTNPQQALWAKQIWEPILNAAQLHTEQ
jgi:hypothetical protein